MSELKLKPGTLELKYQLEEEVSIRVLRQQQKIIIELSESYNTNLNNLKNQMNNLNLNNLDDIKNIQSSTNPEQYYECNFTKNTCTCPDFKYRNRICKHLNSNSNR